jgi:hypothetical protein
MKSFCRPDSGGITKAAVSVERPLPRPFDSGVALWRKLTDVVRILLPVICQNPRL